MSDEQHLTICGGRQSYMDFFSEVFCVVIFKFFFLHTKKPQNTKMENIIKEWKKKTNKLGVTFPNTDSVKAVNEQLY